MRKAIEPVKLHLTTPFKETSNNHEVIIVQEGEIKVVESIRLGAKNAITDKLESQNKDYLQTTEQEKEFKAQKLGSIKVGSQNGLPLTNLLKNQIHNRGVREQAAAAKEASIAAKAESTVKNTEKAAMAVLSLKLKDSDDATALAEFVKKPTKPEYASLIQWHTEEKPTGKLAVVEATWKSLQLTGVELKTKLKAYREQLEEEEDDIDNDDEDDNNDNDNDNNDNNDNEGEEANEQVDGREEEGDLDLADEDRGGDVEEGGGGGGDDDEMDDDNAEVDAVVEQNQQQVVVEVQGVGTAKRKRERVALSPKVYNKRERRSVRGG